MVDLVLTAAVAFFVTIDPLGIGPIFVALTRGADARHRRLMAIRGVAVAAAILLVFALVGEPLLEALGIGLPAFRLAGGILLLLAIDMVFARPSGLRSTTAGEEAEAALREDISVFPLAIPLIAGPGAMTTLLLLLGRVEGDLMAQLVVLAVLGATLAVTLGVLMVAAQVTRMMGVTGINVVHRVLGILLAALACQFILDGLSQGAVML